MADFVCSPLVVIFAFNSINNYIKKLMVTISDAVVQKNTMTKCDELQISGLEVICGKGRFISAQPLSLAGYVSIITRHFSADL
ncbi:hypothetical protein ACLK1Z_24155 [Escherichia coli]